MAVIQIPNLPAAIALSGSEQLEIVQAGVSCRTTTQAIADLNEPFILQSSVGYFGSFYDTTTQTNPVASTPNAMAVNTVVAQKGVVFFDGSKIRIPAAGVYNIQFSAQFEKTDAGTDVVDIWLVKNGTNVTESNTQISLVGNNAKSVPAWNFILEFNANDYFQIFWSSPDTNVRILHTAATTGPVRPAVPSVILTVQQVGITDAGWYSPQVTAGTVLGRRSSVGNGNIEELPISVDASNNVSLPADLSVAGALGVTGATTLSSTLDVTGATTLSNTLGVTGATTLSSTLGVTGAVTLGTQQTTQGSLVLANTAAGAFATTIKSSNSASAAWTFTLPTTAGTNGYILTTNGSGVSSWTNPTALGIDIDVGSTAITSGTTGRVLYDNAGVVGEYTTVPLSFGGTNANLTASNGGIFYSTATAGAILAGTATANQVLLSGSSAAPSWSTATYPATTTINQVLYSSSANTVTGLATTNGGILNASATGVPSITVNPTIGVQQTTQGSIILANTAAGAFPTTLKSSNSASAAWTLTLPTTAGTNNYVLTTNGSGVSSWSQVSLTAGVTGILPVANGGTNASSASITAFNNITGYTAAGATGTTSTNLVFSTNPTLSYLVLAAGTATAGQEPLKFTSGTNLTTAEAGAVEYDGKVFYATSVASSRQIIASPQVVVVGATPVSLSNSSTSAQNVFAAANDTLTLDAATTYFFEAFLYISTGTTTHTTAFGFGGTATFTSILYFSELISSAATTIATAASYLEVVAATATVLNATSAAATTKIKLHGAMRINAGGTIIPQITFSAGPTGTCQVNTNSFFRIWPVGSNTVEAVGNWS